MPINTGVNHRKFQIAARTREIFFEPDAGGYPSGSNSAKSTTSQNSVAEKNKPRRRSPEKSKEGRENQFRGKTRILVDPFGAYPPNQNCRPASPTPLSTSHIHG
jgi:hypothetical protein